MGHVSRECGTTDKRLNSKTSDAVKNTKENRHVLYASSGFRETKRDAQVRPGAMPVSIRYKLLRDVTT